MGTEEVGSAPKSAASEAADREMRFIRDAIRGLEFGSVTIIVQNGVIVQIDRTDRRRVRPSART